jgi:uncharacterized protein (TIGR00369 family)
MNDKPATDPAPAFDPAAHGWERVRGHNFGELVGPIWRRGDALFGFLSTEKHRNHRGIVHGGMLTTFADQAMGMTGRRSTGEKPHATIQIGMQFIGAVKVGDFVEAHCEIVRQTRSVLFIESKLTVNDGIVATASGIWKILGER